LFFWHLGKGRNASHLASITGERGSRKVAIVSIRIASSWLFSFLNVMASPSPPEEAFGNPQIIRFASGNLFLFLFHFSLDEFSINDLICQKIARRQQLLSSENLQ
jgi:hypothetical protein